MNGNLPELKQWLDNPSGQFELEQYSDTSRNTNNIWLAYEPDESIILLVKCSQHDSRQQSFNHVIFEEEALQEFRELLPTIIDDALTQIESGKCWRFSPTANLQYHFVEEKNCEEKH